MCVSAYLRLSVLCVLIVTCVLSAGVFEKVQVRITMLLLFKQLTNVSFLIYA